MFEKRDLSIKNIILIDQIKSFYNSLITSNVQLQRDHQKNIKKLNSYKDKLLKEDSLNMQELSNIQYDNLLLIYKIKEKDDIIKGITKSLEILKQNLMWIFIRKNQRNKR